jgi:hypothetical protein
VFAPTGASKTPTVSFPTTDSVYVPVAQLPCGTAETGAANVKPALAIAIEAMTKRNEVLFIPILSLNINLTITVLGS